MYCAMCNSFYCMHSIGGMANAQQMGAMGISEIQRYNNLIHSGSGTLSTSAPTKTEPEKMTNKKLLLLRK